MDALSAIFQIIMVLLGIYQEHELTKAQCEQMWHSGYVVYPLSEEELKRSKQCSELMEDE